MNEELWTELEKIDVLRERLGVNYELAKQALDAAGGDVVQALADLERYKTAYTREWKERGHVVWDRLQDKIGDLNRTRINLRRHNRTIFSISAPLGLALAYSIWRRPGLRLLGMAGVVGAALGDCEWEVNQMPPVMTMDPRRAAYSQTEMGI